MSVNKVILLGNVGRDPEVRYLDIAVAVERQVVFKINYPSEEVD